MLGILILYLSTYVMGKWRGLECNLHNITSQKNIMILIVIMTLVFWILHAILSENKKVGRYEENWQEDSIRFVRGLTVILEAALYIGIIKNVDKGFSIYHNVWIYCIGIVILNIIQIAIFDREYTSNMRELIVDSILIQIQDTRNMLLLALAISCILSWTIVGFIFVFSFLAIIFKW